MRELFNLITVCSLVMLVINALGLSSGQCQMKGVAFYEQRPMTDCTPDQSTNTQHGSQVVRTSGALSSLSLTVCLNHSEVETSEGLMGKPGKQDHGLTRFRRHLYMSWNIGDEALHNHKQLKIRVTAPGAPSVAQCLYVDLVASQADDMSHRPFGQPGKSDAAVSISLSPLITAYIVDITARHQASLHLLYRIVVDELHPNSWISPSIAVTSYNGRVVFTISAPHIAQEHDATYSAHLIHCAKEQEQNTDSERISGCHLTEQWSTKSCGEAVDETLLDYDKFSIQPLTLPLEKGYYQLWVDAVVRGHGYIRRTVKTPSFYIPKCGNFTSPSTQSALPATAHKLTQTSTSLKSSSDYSVPLVAGLVSAGCLLIVALLVLGAKKLYYSRVMIMASMKSKHFHRKCGDFFQSGNKDKPRGEGVCGSLNSLDLDQSETDVKTLNFESRHRTESKLFANDHQFQDVSCPDELMTSLQSTPLMPGQQLPVTSFQQRPIKTPRRTLADEQNYVHSLSECITLDPDCELSIQHDIKQKDKAHSDFYNMSDIPRIRAPDDMSVDTVECEIDFQNVNRDYERNNQVMMVAQQKHEFFLTRMKYFCEDIESISDSVSV